MVLGACIQQSLKSLISPFPRVLQHTRGGGCIAFGPSWEQGPPRSTPIISSKQSISEYKGREGQGVEWEGGYRPEGTSLCLVYNNATVAWASTKGSPVFSLPKVLYQMARSLWLMPSLSDLRMPWFCSVHSVVSDSLRPNEPQHTRSPCPSPTPGVHPNSGVHWVSDAIQPSHPLSAPSPPALNLPQHQGRFKWVSSPHQVAKVLEFQLQHQSFQWTPRTDLLWDGLVGSPCSTRDSQESSPIPQFKNISS